jgi:hypothetical protein
MPIGTIETINQRIRKLVYGRADGMPNSLESMVVCDSFSVGGVYVLLCCCVGRGWVEGGRGRGRWLVEVVVSISCYCYSVAGRKEEKLEEQHGARL